MTARSQTALPVSVFPNRRMLPALAQAAVKEIPEHIEHDLGGPAGNSAPACIWRKLKRDRRWPNAANVSKVVTPDPRPRILFPEGMETSPWRLRMEPGLVL